MNWRFHYLVKPVAFERFLQATNKALLFSSYRSSLHSKPNSPESIFINVDYALVKISLSEIMYVEGMKDYIRIHCLPPRKPVITKVTMKGMQEILPGDRFMRIHRSFIVSTASIQVIKKDSIILTGDQTELPVSDTYRPSVIEFTGRH
ncbi:MAG: LytTR family transcriptional regulator DNA-binding domain-containing protein [Chitinophagaceae bacterium]